MSKVRRVFNWLKRYGWMILVVVGTILGAVVGGAFVRKLRKPSATIKRELDVMKAGAEAAAHAVETDAKTALEAIEKTESETIEALNDVRRSKYEKLRASGDPESVMRYLERLADPGRRKRYTRGP